MKRIHTILSAILLMVTTFAFAQNMAVKGTVTDVNGEPVVGAVVLVKASATGAVTDLDGKWHLSDVAPDATLVVSCMGYTTQEVKVSGRKVIDMTLNADANLLDEVVVTAMGISRSEKSIGYAATTVKSDELKSAHATNIANALTGKVAGVQVQATSSDPGAATNIIIRGFSSISGSNQPLYVVDGVPLQNLQMNAQEKSTALAGVGNLSTEDIENMTILKGAAATALYGSRAANGVVLITTKAGKKGAERNFSIDYNGGVQLRQVATLPMMQNSWGQGWNGVQTYIENGSWGPALDGSVQVYGPIWNYQQRIHEYSAKPKNIEEFFDLGVSHNHSLAFSGASGDNKVTYYLSYSYTGDDGIMPGKKDTYQRNTIAFRGSYEATKWLKISSSINFARNSSDVVGTFQGTSVIDGLYEFPRDISLVDMKDLSIAFNTPEAYLTPYGITNPYWSLENNKNHNDAKQINGKVQVDIKPVKQLTLTYRMGVDYADYDTKIGFPQIALDDALINDDKGYAPKEMNQAGWVEAIYGRNYETNHDILANYADKFFNDKFEVNVLLGLNINERAATSLTGETDNLTFNTGFWDLSNGSIKQTIAEGQSKRRLIGLFGDVTLGYNDEVFLELTARNDWSSTLPINANNYFYPGATLSWIFSKRIPQNDVLTFGKLRLAYGMTGNDAPVYRTKVSYTQAYANGYYGSNIALFPMNGTNSFIAAATKGSGTLRPEMTKEFEVGTNLQFFEGRLGLDLTYYNRKTTDQIFTLPVDPATGYNSMVTNFGTVSNQGVELVLNTVPVQTKDFRWSLDFNFAKNYNKVESLPDALEGGKSQINSFSAGSDVVYVYAELGKPMGQFYTKRPQLTPDGRPIVGSNGYPLIGADAEDTGLNFQSDWTGGVTTNLTYKGFSLGAVLDVRQGGYMFSRTKNLMQFTGNGIATTYNDRRPFIIPNSVVSDGKGGYVENTTPIFLYDGSYQTWCDTYGFGKGGEYYLLDRSFVKLRNVTLSYSFPAKLLAPIKLSALSLSVFCNNAFTWTAADNYFIDPDITSFAGSGDLAAQFGELYSNPACRIWGMGLNIKF